MRPFISIPARAMAAAVVAVVLAAAGTSSASAQLLVKPDGQWRYSLGLGATVTSGNSSSSSLSVTTDAVKATERNKWTLYGRLLRAEDDDETTSDQVSAGGRYDRELGNQWFQFAILDWLRDRPANISRRLSFNTGIGYHFFKEERSFWDVFAGLGYSHDNLVEATVISDELRDSYGRAELLVGEQSQHALGDTTTITQRLSIYPNLRDSGGYRGVFDTTLAVAINRTFALTASLNYRYNSDPGTGLDKKDMLFITGIMVRIE